MTNCTCPGRNPTRPANVPCDANMMYVAGSQVVPGDWLVLLDGRAALVEGVVVHTGYVSIAVEGRKPFTEASCANRVVYRRPEGVVPCCVPTPPLCGCACATQRDLVPRADLVRAEQRTREDEARKWRRSTREMRDRAEAAEAKLAALREALSDL